MEDSDQDICKLNLQKAVLAAEFYTSSAPLVARHLMQEAEVLKRQINVIPCPSHIVCRHCGSIFRPGNHSARLAPKMKVSKVMERFVALSSDERRRKPLSKVQRRMVTMYSKTTNRLILRCLMCGRRTIIACQGRKVKQPKIKPMKVVPLSYNEKRKLKKKEKRRLKAQQKQSMVADSPGSSHAGSDSGVGSTLSSLALSDSLSGSQMSLVPQMTSTPVRNSTPSTSFKNVHPPSSMDASFTSLQSTKTKPPSAPPAHMMPPPAPHMLSVSCVNTTSSTSPGCATRSTINLSSEMGDNSHSRLLGDVSGRSGSKVSKSKKIGKHNVLQKMLANEKERKEDKGGLERFLSGL